MKWDIKIVEDTGNGYLIEDINTGKQTEVSYERYEKVQQLHEKLNNPQ